MHNQREHVCFPLPSPYPSSGLTQSRVPQHLSTSASFLWSVKVTAEKRWRGLLRARPPPNPHLRSPWDPVCLGECSIWGMWHGCYDDKHAICSALVGPRGGLSGIHCTHKKPREIWSGQEVLEHQVHPDWRPPTPGCHHVSLGRHVPQNSAPPRLCSAVSWHFSHSLSLSLVGFQPLVWWSIGPRCPDPFTLPQAAGEGNGGKLSGSQILLGQGAGA